MHGVATTNASTMTRTIAPMRFARDHHLFLERARRRARASRGGDGNARNASPRRARSWPRSSPRAAAVRMGFAITTTIGTPWNIATGWRAPSSTCYAAYGCNVDAVTDHYAKAAGIDAQKKTSETRFDGGVREPNGSEYAKRRDGTATRDATNVHFCRPLLYKVTTCCNAEQCGRAPFV